MVLMIEINLGYGVELPRFDGHRRAFVVKLRKDVRYAEESPALSA
jgi:hypothetical protein